MAGIRSSLTRLLLIPLVAASFVAAAPSGDKHALVNELTKLAAGSHANGDELRLQPDHCARTSVGDVHFSNDLADGEQGAARLLGMQLDVALHSTLCFRLVDPTNDTRSEWLHTLRVDQLRHEHPVSQHYVFAIPYVNTSCACDCRRDSTVCTATKFHLTGCERTARSDTSCYRSFLAQQPDVGCSELGPSEEIEPRMCCETRLRPADGLTFSAVRIEAPATFARLVYSAFDWHAGGWRQRDRTELTAQLDGNAQNRVLDHSGRLQITVSSSGRAAHQLDGGMYFARHNPGAEADQLRRQPLNDLHENSFDRLGWYRWNETARQFGVRNGVARIQRLLDARAEDCRAQKYLAFLEANYYMPDHFNLSEPLERRVPWLQSARLVDAPAQRSVTVVHRDGVALKLLLQVVAEGDGTRLSFVHNASRLGDFLNGTIVVNEFSERYLMLSVRGAANRLEGAVQSLDSSETSEFQIDDYRFSAWVPSFSASAFSSAAAPHNRSDTQTLFVQLPSWLAPGARTVCLWASTDAVDRSRSICRRLEFVEKPLQIDHDRGTWRYLEGSCTACNDYRPKTKWNFLTPSFWFGEVKSFEDVFRVTATVLVLAVAAVVLYALFKLILFPACSCISGCARHMSDKRREKRHFARTDELLARALERQFQAITDQQQQQQQQRREHNQHRKQYSRPTAPPPARPDSSVSSERRIQQLSNNMSAPNFSRTYM